MNYKGFFSNRSVDDYLKDLNKHFFGGAMKVPLIAIDDGYAQCNYAFVDVEMVDGVAELVIREGKIPSHGRRGQHVVGGMGAAASGLYSCEQTGESYTIHQYVSKPEDTRTTEYPVSSLNRFLIHSILFELGLGGHDVAILTGLPLDQFLDGEGGINTPLLARKAENLTKPVVAGVMKRPSANVVYVGTYPEGVSGMVDYMINQYGEKRVQEGVVRLGIDIGGNTTDLAILLPDNQIGAHKTESSGVNHVRDKLRSLLIKRFSYEPDQALLNEALMTRQITWFGAQPESVELEVNEAVMSVIDPIMREIDGFKKEYPSLREIVGFGGGVLLMGSVIKAKYPHIQIIEDADGANARGFLKYAITDSLDAIMGSIDSAVA